MSAAMRDLLIMWLWVAAVGAVLGAAALLWLWATRRWPFNPPSPAAEPSQPLTTDDPPVHPEDIWRGQW